MELSLEIWHFWLVACLFLFVLEVFVPGFILGCLAIGALGGMFASWFSPAWEIQLIAASVTATVSFIFIRPFALKRLFNEHDLKTNVDSLIGRRGRVSQRFDPHLRKGRVAIDGDDWMAYTIHSQELAEGHIVEIIQVKSNSLIVKPIESDS